MALPNWTIELLRRSVNEMAEKARQPETIEKIKAQASELLNELPQTAARSLDAVMRSAEAGRQSVERWTRKHTQLSIPVLNASGTLLTPRGTGVPLADPVVEVGREILAGDAVSGEVLHDRLARRLSRLVPKDSDCVIAVANRFDSAVASLAAFSSSRTIAVHRSDCVRLPSGQALPAALSSIGVTLAGLRSTVLEVGSSDHREVSDFDSVERPCVVWADGGSKPIEPFDLSGRDAIQVAVLPIATLKEMAATELSIPAAETMLNQVDLVILSGAGLIGGPPSGIIIGDRELVETLTRSSAWPSLAATDATIAMLTVALEMASSSIDTLPIQKLIEISEDNLKGRAERMATRLSGSDQIASCQVTADDAEVAAGGRWHLPSRQVCVRHASRSAKEWAAALADDVPAVITSSDDEFLKIDLRWIQPADDAKLAELIGGLSEATSPNDPAEAAT